MPIDKAKLSEISDYAYECLGDLEYVGISRTFNFIDTNRYEIVSEITFLNRGNNKCFYIPGDIYKKETLINYDIEPKNIAIPIHSDYGDYINLKFIFNELKKLILEYLSKNKDKKENDYAELLSNFEVNSELFKDFIEKGIWSNFNSSYSMGKKINDIFSSYKEVKQDPIIETFLNFLSKLDRFFVQFVYIIGGIEGGSYFKLRTTTIKVVEDMLKKRNIIKPCIYELELPTEIGKPYLLNGTDSFHLTINIPQYEKFKYKKRDGFENTEFQKKNFKIFHENDDKKKFCCQLLDFVSFNTKYFGDNNITLYFKLDEEKIDNKEFFIKNHYISFKKTLGSNLKSIYILLSILLIILYVFLFIFRLNLYLTIFIGILLTTTFDYVNRNRIEKYYIIKPFIYFILFIVILSFKFLIVYSLI